MMTESETQQNAAQPPELVIHSKEQWEVLSSTTRAGMIECLYAIGPASIKEIAASLGCSAALVHHHMPLLLEAGFVKECASRQLPRHTERVFADSGLAWIFDPQRDPPAFIEGMSKMARAWSRSNERLVAEALAGKDGDQLAELMNSMMFRSESAFLRPAAEERVQKHLEAIKRIFQEERASTEGEHRTMYWSYVPMTKK